MLKASAGLQQVPKTRGVVEARSLTVLMPYPVIGHKISIARREAKTSRILSHPGALACNRSATVNRL
jgi:hypothetical protein